MTREQHARLDILVAAAVFNKHVQVYPQQDAPDIGYVAQGGAKYVLRYSQSLDALAPALEAFAIIDLHNTHRQWFVTLMSAGLSEPHWAQAETLPIALCLALLVAHGVDVREAVKG